MPSCWAGWAGSARGARAASKGPAVTVPTWPGTSPRLGCGWWRWIVPTGRTGGGRASPTRWMRSARPGRPSPGERPARRRAATGRWEAIRALMVAKRSARSERIQTINQARALIVTGPDDLRARFARHAPAELVAGLGSLRPRPGSMVRYHTLLSLRELGRRAQFLDGQLQRLDEFIVPPVTARAPGLLALYGVGPDTAAMLLVAAGDHPERLRSEAAWAHLCATAPLSASSGKVTRYRLNPGG